METKGKIYSMLQAEKESCKTCFYRNHCGLDMITSAVKCEMYSADRAPKKKKIVW